MILMKIPGYRSGLRCRHNYLRQGDVALITVPSMCLRCAVQAYQRVAPRRQPTAAHRTLHGDGACCARQPDHPEMVCARAGGWQTDEGCPLRRCPYVAASGLGESEAEGAVPRASAGSASATGCRTRAGLPSCRRGTTARGPRARVRIAGTPATLRALRRA